MPHFEIRPVEKQNWADFENLFLSKGAPSYCWCMADRITKEERLHDSKECRKTYIKRRVDESVPIGLLAYGDDGSPVAWCSVAPRDSFQSIGGDERLEGVWSITCFYIKREYRRKGLAKRLIESAKAYAETNGAKYVEAYPVKSDSPSYRYMGFIAMFEAAGFSFVKTQGTRKHVMVYSLSGQNMQ
jgi:GNAT superfamily N-acetyltransferase